MTEKTAYVIEGTTIIVPTKDNHRQALERLMGMLWHATAPDSTEVYIHQDTAAAFALGNRDAQVLPRLREWRTELPKDVTTVYETGLRMSPTLHIYQEPRITSFVRPSHKAKFEAKSIHTLSTLMKQEGEGLGRNGKCPIAQFQVDHHIHLCVHEDNLEEMAAYAEVQSSENTVAAKLAKMLEEAVIARQSEAERKASKCWKAGLMDLLKGQDGPELPRRVA
jgi:hypothetical protein